MTFTLNTSKKEINKTILKRGRDYFRGDQIIDLEEIEQGSWSTRVQGSDEYRVLHEIRQTIQNRGICN